MTKLHYSFIVLFAISLFSCEDDSKDKTPKTLNVETLKEERVVPPSFDADSAFYFVKAQTDFGPRVPNTDAHAKCAIYLENELKRFGADVIVQTGSARAFDGNILHMKNIIGQFSPEKEKRILLCSHWDSRAFADKDEVSEHNTPIDGANDGASGVGVLLEIARAMQQKQPELGIDIILFDAEDYGATESAAMSMPNQDRYNETWCLGSQYWGKNLHKPGYRAKYGILLDMVGAKDAVFLKEEYSMQFGLKIVNKVWDRAAELGYGNMFQKRLGGAITDDHYYVSKYAGIPCIDIIHYDNEKGFGEFHHTLDDNINIIDKNTLKAVGDVVLDVIYNEK